MIWRKCFNAPGSIALCAIAAVILLSFISLKAQSPTADADTLAALKSAVTLEARHDATSGAMAVSALKPLVPRLPKLADYVAWFLASAQFDAADYESVPRTLDTVFTQTPVSPLRGRAAMLAAQALENSNRAGDAVALLKKYATALPQPQGDLENAKAALAAGDSVGAAIFSQRVFYGYPVSAEAADAQALLTTLQASLADRYPSVLSVTLLSRATKLIAAGQYALARRELVSMQAQLSGAELDTAHVKVGVTDYLARNTLAADRYLKALSVTSPAADAERLYYIFLCARRSDDHEKIDAALDQLASRYPASPFRMEALVGAANSYLVANRADDYEPLFRACYQSFPKEGKAADCHWKVTWAHYLQRRSDALDLLREQVQLFPESDSVPAALYYLARIEEANGDRASAAAYDREVARRYPARYYGVLARTRLEDAQALSSFAASSVTLPAFLRSLPVNARTRTRDFLPNTTSRLRIERARLLATAGLDDWWTIELRFAAQTEDQPHVIALELARIEDIKGAPDQALHDLKHFVPDYLSLNTDSFDASSAVAAASPVPIEFWRLAFPMPYRADLEKYAAENNLDPFLVAALVRQESEFNPKAISAANARGLAQIMPETGRELSRRIGLRPYTLAHLFTPQVNLRLGTYYLRSISDRVNGRWEAVLAAYNAGLSRATTWSTWGEFREPAEFVETVPFTQTREYIQIVLRNADIYRRLYGAKTLARDGAPAIRLSYSWNEGSPAIPSNNGH